MTYWIRTRAGGPHRCDEGLYLYRNAGNDGWKLVDGRFFPNDVMTDELKVVAEIPDLELLEPADAPTEWASEVAAVYLGKGGEG